MCYLIPIFFIDAILLTLAYKKIKQVSKITGFNLKTKLILLSGIIISIFIGIFNSTLSYKIKPNVKLVGIPFPGAVLQYENGGWIDFVPEDFFLYAIVIANILFTISLGVLLCLKIIKIINARAIKKRI